MQRIERGESVGCRVGFSGDFSAWLGKELVVTARTVALLLEPQLHDSRADRDEWQQKEIGRVCYGIFRPLSFPHQPIPYDLEPDLGAPLRKIWDPAHHRPVSWLAAKFPQLRREFLVFASIDIDSAASGRRIGLAVMADLINRHLPPGGIAMLNPYPLKYLVRDSHERIDATPEEKQRGVAALKRHYTRLGLEDVETEPDLMVIQRPAHPLRAPRCNLRFTRAQYARLRPFAGSDAHGAPAHSAAH